MSPRKARIEGQGASGRLGGVQLTTVLHVIILLAASSNAAEIDQTPRGKALLGNL